MRKPIIAVLFLFTACAASADKPASRQRPPMRVVTAAEAEELILAGHLKVIATTHENDMGRVSVYEVQCFDLVDEVSVENDAIGRRLADLLSLPKMSEGGGSYRFSFRDLLRTPQGRRKISRVLENRDAAAALHGALYGRFTAVEELYPLMCGGRITDSVAYFQSYLVNPRAVLLDLELTERMKVAALLHLESRELHGSGDERATANLTLASLRAYLVDRSKATAFGR